MPIRPMESCQDQASLEGSAMKRTQHTSLVEWAITLLILAVASALSTPTPAF